MDILELIKKFTSYENDTILIDSLIDDTIIYLNTLDDYNKTCFLVEFMDNSIDETIEMIIPEIFLRLPSLKKRLSDIDDNFNNTIFYDNKDVGCYVKNKLYNFIVFKRDGRKVYDKYENEYHVDDCVPLTKKEIRDFKISKILV